MDADGGGSSAALLCPSAPFENAAQIVAAGISGNELVLLSASGERRLAASFDPSGDASSPARSTSLRTADHRVTATLGSETIRLDRSFRLLYHLREYANAATDSGIVVTSSSPPHFVSADGAVTSYGDVSAPLTLYLMASAVPDDAGWLLAEWTTPASVASTHGLFNVDGRRVPFFTGATYSQATLAGTPVFLHGGPPYTLTFGSPTGVVDVPFDVPNTMIAPTYFWISGTGTIGLVTSGYDDRVFRVDSVTHSYAPVTAAFAPTGSVAAGAGRVVVSANGRWFLRTDSNGTPLWTYDAAKDVLTMAHLEQLAPLHPLDGEYCNGPPIVLGDGSYAMGLRTGAVAGYYAVDPNGHVARVGRPVRDVTGITASRVNETWILSADSGKNSYCPQFSPFTGDPADPSVITGNSVQIVAPSAAPVVFQSADEWQRGLTEVHPSGLCVFHIDQGTNSGAVYDPVTGTKTSIGEFESFAWLP
jgi:hypothetical protein